MGLAEDLDTGRIGFFWPIDSGSRLELDADPLRGYLRRDGQWTLLEALEEDVEAAWMRDDPLVHEAIAGVLVDHSVLLLEVRPGGFNRNFGGFRASVQRHEARTVISEVPLDRLRTCGLRELQARFLGVSQWAGMSAVTEQLEQDARGHGRAWSTRVESKEPVQARLRGGGVLRIEADWRTEGRRDLRTVAAPTAITCRFTSPRPIWDLLRPLARVQELLSFLHGGFVSAHSGTAVLHLTQSPEVAPAPALWNGLLMAPGPSAPSLPDNVLVLMTLDQLGGARGLARWIHIATEHPRAVRPFLNRYRYGPTTAEVGVMEAAAAIEYWVNAHRRTAAWANAPGSQAERLVAHLGRGFKTWIPKPAAWAQLLRDTNNGLKHDPTASADPQLLADLSHSAQLVLAAATLNSAAPTKAPAALIFAHHRFAGLGERLRAALL